jgi:hypothetical protein
MRTGSILARRQVDRRVLASSIDLDIELQPVTLIEVGHAGTLYSADVHECVRLAVIACDETEALHRVEELHRAGRLFTRKLTLLRSFAFLNGDYVTDDNEIGRRNLATAIDEGEFQLLAFAKPFKARALNRTDVDEYVFAAVFALDKAEALAAVEELYDATTLTDDLRGHSATTRSTSPTAATEAATTATAAKSAAIAAAETTTSATAEAIAAAGKPVAATTETITAAARKWIESVFSEAVPLVPAPAAPSSVKTHINQITFVSPIENRPTARTKRAGHQGK